MKRPLLRHLKPLLKPALRMMVVGSLVLTLFLNGGSALAARTGGRVGGGSFTRPAPSRPYTPPSSRGYPTAPYPGGGYGYPSGGFGFPFLLPLFGFGGGAGGLFTILITIAIANFLLNSFRQIGQSREMGTLGYGNGYANPTVSLNSLSVGLLAEARELQPELDKIARAADTSSSSGLTDVLQEATLALLRHPEYWVYASTSAQQTRFEAAEAQFNRLALGERSKIRQETLTNYNKQLRESQQPKLSAADGQPGQPLTRGPSEYIVVTLLVASQGKLELPKINSAADLRQALSLLGAISSEQLLAMELLWQPQAAGDTLSADDLVASYPDLKLI